MLVLHIILSSPERVCKRRLPTGLIQYNVVGCVAMVTTQYSSPTSCSLHQRTCLNCSQYAMFFFSVYLQFFVILLIVAYNAYRRNE